MKKLLLLLITLIAVITLGGCVTAPPTDYSNEFKELKSENELLESDLAETQAQLDTIQSYLDRLVCTSCYLLPENNGIDAMKDMQVSISYYESLSDTEKDLVDVTKFPEYVWDDLGEYVPLNDLCNLLTQKYLNMPSTCTGTYQIKLQLASTSSFTNEEAIVRISMLLMELSYYDFYLDYDIIHIELIEGASRYMNVQSSLFTTPKYEGALHPSIVWLEMFEVNIYNFEYDATQLDIIYQTFITEETFIGYVLDYK